MDIDYIRVIDSFVETVNTPILVIDDRSYVISSNKAAVDLLGLETLYRSEYGVEHFIDTRTVGVHIGRHTRPLFKNGE